MGAVAVDLDALDVLGVDVAGDVVAAVDDQDRLAGALGGVGKDGAREAGTDDEVVEEAAADAEAEADDATEEQD